MNDNFRSIWPDWTTEKPYAVLVVGVLLMGFTALATDVLSDLRALPFVGRSPLMPNTVTVVGEGKVTAAPDVVTLDLGVLTTSKKVVEAQSQNSKQMNELIARLQSLGIPEVDLQTTQYAITPRYDYLNGRTVLSGYDVQQTLRVKIRDFADKKDRIDVVLRIAGEVGSNQVGGLNATVDEPEVLRAAAREKAIRNAQRKAADLSRTLGVKLGPVISFSEETSRGPDPVPPYFARDLGAGGGGDSAQGQLGQLDILSAVTVSYELR